MTTPTPTIPPGWELDPVYLGTAELSLARWGADAAYPFTVGVLGEVIRQVAILHTGCDTRHCGICQELAYGLAALAVLNAREGAHL